MFATNEFEAKRSSDCREKEKGESFFRSACHVTTPANCAFEEITSLRRKSIEASKPSMRKKENIVDKDQEN